MQHRQKLESLQALRFAAAMAVVLHHAGSGYVLERGGRNPFEGGVAGVDVFFVLSGFIMAWTVVSGNRPQGAAGFAFRRFARIAPLYWFLTTLLVAIAVAAPGLLGDTELSAEALLHSYLFVPYEKPSGAVQPLLFLGWTLCYEMFFYAIFSLSLLVAPGRPVLTATAIVSGIVLTGALARSDSVLGQFYTSPILLEFVVGMAVCVLWQRWKPSFPTGLCLIAAGLALFQVDAPVPAIVVTGLSSGLIVFGTLSWPPGALPFRRTLVGLGDASYSLYLLHPYALQLPIKLLGPVSPAVLVLLVIASVLASLVLARLSFLLVERPAQRAILSLREKALAVP